MYRQAGQLLSTGSHVSPTMPTKKSRATGPRLWPLHWSPQSALMLSRSSLSLLDIQRLHRKLSPGLNWPSSSRSFQESRGASYVCGQFFSARREHVGRRRCRSLHLCHCSRNILYQCTADFPRSETWDLEEVQRSSTPNRSAQHSSAQRHRSHPVDPKGHYYGSGIVKPARLEPVVESGYVWVTEEAYSVLREAIDRHEIRGHVLKSLGRRELAKGAGAIEVYCLLEENEREPQLAPQVATLPHDADNALITSRELARISSALAVNQYVENFHLFASQCRTLLDLDRVFASYHIECLLSLRLLSRPEPANGNVSFDADVLLLSAGKLAPFQSATSEGASPRSSGHVSPGRRGETFVEPSTGDGLCSIRPLGQQQRRFGCWGG